MLVLKSDSKNSAYSNDVPKSYRIKIVYLITDLKLAGAQKVLLQVVQNLNRDKYLPFVVCLFGSDSPITKELKSSKVPVIDLEMKSKYNLVPIIRLLRFLLLTKPVILHSSLFHANIIGRIIGKLARVPIIISWRHSTKIGGRFRVIVNKITSNLDDAKTAISPKIRDLMIEETGFDPKNVFIVHNCIDLKNFHPPSSKQIIISRNKLNLNSHNFVIGSVARLHFDKGIDILIKSIKKLNDESVIPNIKCLIIGKGPEYKKLKSLTRKYKIDKIVVFPGERENIPDILFAIDLFVLPSRVEGISISFLEAMASGLPIIGTNVGSTPDIIKNYETGILIPPNNPVILAQKILEIYSSPTLGYELGENARKYVQNYYSIEKTIDELDHIYTQLRDEKGY